MGDEAANVLHAFTAPRTALSVYACLARWAAIDTGERRSQGQIRLTGSLRAMTRELFPVRCALLVFEHDMNVTGTRLARLESAPENLPRRSMTQNGIPDEYRRPLTKCQTRLGDPNDETALGEWVMEGRVVLDRSIQHGAVAV